MFAFRRPAAAIVAASALSGSWSCDALSLMPGRPKGVSFGEARDQAIDKLYACFEYGAKFYMKGAKGGSIYFTGGTGSCPQGTMNRNSGRGIVAAFGANGRDPVEDSDGNWRYPEVNGGVVFYRKPEMTWAQARDQAINKQFACFQYSDKFYMKGANGGSIFFKKSAGKCPKGTMKTNSGLRITGLFGANGRDPVKDTHGNWRYPKVNGGSVTYAKKYSCLPRTDE